MAPLGPEFRERYCCAIFQSVLPFVVVLAVRLDLLIAEAAAVAIAVSFVVVVVVTGGGGVATVVNWLGGLQLGPEDGRYHWRGGERGRELG